MLKNLRLPGFVLASVFLLPVVSAGVATADSAPGDIRFTREVDDTDMAGSFAPSIFPHWVHRIHYRCDACHNSLFEMQLNAVPVNMDLIKQGKVCGTCHNGRLAFGVTLQSCNRCHVSVPE